MRFQTMLTAGGLLLLAVQLTAQTQIPVSPLAQQWMAERAPNALQALRHIYQMPVQKHKTDTDRGGATVLDSAVLYIGYDWNDSFPQTKAEFSYPSANTAVQTEYENLGGWQIQNRAIQKTDSQGRPIELYAETYEPNSGTWIPDSRLRNFPHGNSATLTDSIIAESWDLVTKTWKVVLQNSVTFNLQDQPVTIFNYFYDDGFEIAILEKLYYDANGDNYQTDQLVNEQGVYNLFSRVEREFQQHREVRATTYAMADPNTQIAITKVETSYDASGNAILEETFEADFFTSEWTLSERTEREFDNAHRTVTETNESFGFDAPPPSRINYIFKNDNGEELALEIHSEKDPDTQEWVILEKTYYYFSNTTAAPVIQNGELLTFSPNPTSGILQFSLEGEAQIQVLNAQGQVVQMTPALASKGQLDLGNLPAGQYYITVQQGAVRRTGKIIKL